MSGYMILEPLREIWCSACLRNSRIVWGVFDDDGMVAELESCICEEQPQDE